MAGTNQVVVHYADGKTIKGTTENFFPNRPSFHVRPVGGGPSVEVLCRTLKAVFFVKALDGSSHPDFPAFQDGPGSSAQGKKIAVHFKDGELICGYSLAYVPGREGFFMTPASDTGNNLRIYVVNEAIQEIKAGPEADGLAKKVLAKKPPARAARR